MTTVARRKKDGSNFFSMKKYWIIWMLKLLGLMRTLNDG
jgi:hypothetical protein